MIKLIMDNVYTKVEGADEYTEQKLYDKLSFEQTEFGKDTITIRHLFNRKTKLTYTGLLPYVIELFEELPEEYEIVDKRVKHESNTNFKIAEQFEARPYQQIIIDHATERECIQAATGAGKTFIMAKLIEKFNVQPVLVFAEKVSLIEQIREEFQRFFDTKDIGIVTGKSKEIHPITICSVHSAPEEMIKDAKMIMFDECHHLPAATTSNISRTAENAYYRIGVSATPWRDGGDDLLIEAALSKKKPENTITASMLIDLGFLVPATIYFVPIKEQFKGKNYHKVYEQAIVQNKKRNEAIIKLTEKMRQKKDASVLILIKNIDHGDYLLEKLRKRLGNETFSTTIYDEDAKKDVLIRVNSIEFLSGKDESIRRKAVIRAVKEKKCKILIGSTIADEGLDVPALDTLILAGGGKSSTRAFQRIGRVLRLYEGKSRAVVFDFEDETPILKRHSAIRRKLYRTEEKWEVKKFDTRLLDT